MMNRTQARTFAALVVTLAAVPVILRGYAGGPDPGHSGAPGDQTCARAGCHAGTGNPTAGSIEIDFPQGLTYMPGVKQTWTLRITATGQTYGFQASARLASNERTSQAGGFSSTDATTQILCQDGRVKSATSPCRDTAPLEFITHSMPRATAAFTFEWTPPATDLGPVRVYVAANAANNNGTAAGDRIYTANFTLNPQAGTSQRPAIRTEQPVLQAFLGGARLSAGTWLEIYGTNFTTETKEWAGSDFNGNRAPTELGGVKVNINNKPAFVRFISPNQINVQAPDDDAVGPVDVEVVNAAGASNKIQINKTKTSPALLTTPTFNIGGRQWLAALHTDFTTFVGRTNLIAGVPFRPAKPGDTIIVFAVGCGASNPASPAGQFFADARAVAGPVQFTIGQASATAQGFLAANAVGLCQFNVTVPNVANGDHAVEAMVDGIATGQNLFTTVQQ